MIEKYGTENENLPPTEDQLERIKELYKEGNDFRFPANRQEAEDAIEKYAKKGDKDD